MTIFVGGPQDGIKYTLTGPDGSVAVFNDSTDPNYVGMARWSGLDSSDIRESFDLHAGEPGGIQGQNFRGGRPVTGTIEILGTSTTDRNTKWQRLKRAANALDADATLSFTPDGGLASQVKLRLNQALRRNDDSGWLHKVQLQMMAANPFIESAALHTSTVSASPWQATVTNQGDGESFPTLSITVTAAGTVVITNATSGQQVVLNAPDPTTLLGFVAQVFGSQGAGNGAFSGPKGIAVDGSGNVFVADTGNSRIQKFNASGVYQGQVGSVGNGNGQFSGGPTRLAVDSAGNVFATDTGNSRVQKFNNSLVYQSQFGSSGSGDGQFKTLTGIAIDGSDNIFTTERQGPPSSGQQRVQKFNSAGTFQAKVGSPGSGTGQFALPEGLICDSSGNVFVCDYGNNRIQKFNNSLVYQSQFGSLGAGNGQLNGPKDICRDSSNNLYVVDNGNYRIQKFNASGVYQSQLGSFGSGVSQFYYPQSIAMLKSTTTPLYVLDYGNAGPPDVSKITVGSGLIFDLDFSSRTVLVGGTNAYGYVDVPNSTWWDLGPGDNIIQATGGTTWTINWRDAWL